MIHSQKLGQNGAQIAHGKLLLLLLLLPEEWIIDVEKRVLLKVSGKVDKQETERERERERERENRKSGSPSPIILSNLWSLSRAGPQLTAIAPRWIDSAPVACHGQRVFF